MLVAGAVLGGIKAINPLAEGRCFSSITEPEAVPVAQGAEAPDADEQHPGTAAPWLPALAMGSPVSITDSGAGTLLLEVTAYFASFVSFGTGWCHGMTKILSVTQHTK